MLICVACGNDQYKSRMLRRVACGNDPYNYKMETSKNKEVQIVLSENVKFLGSQSKKSIFSLIDRFELLCCYLLCFCFSTMFDYSKSLSIDSYLLQNFLKQLYDYQVLIVLLLSFIVVIFHYQMVSRKKVEIHCRIVVGDTIRAIVFRYLVECSIILGIAFSASLIISAIVGISEANNLFLSCVFVVYILISSGQVKRFESI